MRTKRVWIQGDRLRVVERLMPGLLANGGPRAASALMREMLPETKKAEDPTRERPTYREVTYREVTYREVRVVPPRPEEQYEAALKEAAAALAKVVHGG